MFCASRAQHPHGTRPGLSPSLSPSWLESTKLVLCPVLHGKRTIPGNHCLWQEPRSLSDPTSAVGSLHPASPGWSRWELDSPVGHRAPNGHVLSQNCVGPSDLSMQTQENRAEISGWQEEGGKPQERDVHVVLGSSSCGPWPDSSTSPSAPCSSKTPGSGLWMPRRHREPVAKAGAVGPAVRRCRGAAGGVGV